MFCRKCGSQLADDAGFCHKCGTMVNKNEESLASTPKTNEKIEDSAKYNIVLTDISNREDLSGKAQMAIAYVLFEDRIKEVTGGSEPDDNIKRQVQDESISAAYGMVQNLPTTLKMSVRKKEAQFFKERLAAYGVTVSLRYCPNCGGALSDMSDSCTSCGQFAIELGVNSNNTANVRAMEPMLGETSSFCRKCGTLSQGEAEFCRKCGSRTGNPPAFTYPAAGTPIQTYPQVPMQTSYQTQTPEIQYSTVSTQPKGKKPFFKRVWVWGMAAVLVLIIIIVASSGDGGSGNGGSGSKGDGGNNNSIVFVETIKAWVPYEANGVTVTVGTVVDKYITSCKWTQRVQEDGVAFVDATGTLTDIDGTSLDIDLTFRLTPVEAREDVVTMEPILLELDGRFYNEFGAQEILSDFFSTYDMNFGRVADYYISCGYDSIIDYFILYHN